MIIMVAGIAGSGKTTIGQVLAAELGWAFADADSLHPPANIAKMRAGVPLTDADRWPWLRAIATWMDERIAAGEPAVVACSALKRSYRDELLAGRDQARMVFLTVGHDEDEARLLARHGHFFPESLLSSQFADLELPGPAERVLVLANRGTPEQTVAEIIRLLALSA
jgi:gluconokinase